MTLPSLSIRSRALLLMAVVAVPYTVLQLYTGVKAYRNTVAAAEDRVVSVAAATASALEQFLSVAERSTGSLAERLGPMLLSAEGCAETIGPLRDAFPYFANLLVVDAEGTLVCSAEDVPGDRTVSAAERDWFQTVRGERRFAVGRPVMGPVTERWVVATGSPILTPDGEFLGAVAGTVALLRLEELLEGRTPRANELVTITTNDGVVVARSVDAEQWVGRSLPSGTVEVERRGPREFVNRTEDVSGLARIWGRVDLPDVGLRVYVGVPADRVTGPNLATLRIETLVSVLSLAGAFLLAYLLFRGISNSMALLGKSVRASAGNDIVEIPQGAPRDVTEVVVQLNRALDERRRAREAERVARERLADIIDNAVFGIYVATLDGRFIQVNRALVSMLGYGSAEELLATPPGEIYRDPATPAELEAAFGDGGLVEDREVELLTADGRPLMVRLNGKLHNLPGGRPAFEMIVEDITEQRALAELARHQQKMEAVGRLAGGVAHEFNNLLTVLGVNSELIRSSLGPDHELSAEVQEVEAALGRARGLTRKLLAFSRKEVTQPHLIEVNQAVTGLKGMLRRVLGEKVALHTELADRAGQVWIDPGHLEQVVLNLVLNARDALGMEGGRIRLATSTQAAAFPVEEGLAALGPARWYTVLTVEDDGPGMDEAIRDLVFEPFFTTKPPGVGTGLGLPTVYGIVTEAGGRVELETAPGKGATFEVWLPVASEDIDGDDVGVPEHGSEAILLVSPNAALRSLTRDALEASGYHVLEAGSAVDALDTFWRAGGPIDLLVTEPGLAQFSDESLIDRLRKEQADLPVLYVSDRKRENTDRSVVCPPFGPATLGHAVRAVLDRAATTRAGSSTAGP